MTRILWSTSFSRYSNQSAKGNSFGFLASIQNTRSLQIFSCILLARKKKIDQLLTTTVRLIRESMQQRKWLLWILKDRRSQKYRRSQFITTETQEQNLYSYRLPIIRHAILFKQKQKIPSYARGKCCSEETKQVLKQFQTWQIFFNHQAEDLK